MREYLAFYFSLLFIAALVLLLPVACFYFAGEYTAYEKVVRQQRNTPHKCLYGLALHNTDFDYKVYLLREVKPKIVVLGSSRVLQMRAQFFSQPAMTAGRAMTSITEGRAFLHELLKNPPEILIIGVDYAWFNGRDPQPDIDVKFPVIKAGPDNPGIFSDGIKFYKWLWQGRLSLSDLTGVFDSDSCDIGLAARNKKKGYGPDGSYYYTDIITGSAPNGDSGFNNSLMDVEKGIGGFKYATSADDDSVDGFLTLVETLEKNHIHTMIFFPPYASAVNERMSRFAGKYTYINDLKHKFRQQHVSYYDFTDASTLGADDCEFVDGFHGGEVLYARILNAMADRDVLLKRYVNDAYLQQAIAAHQGKAFIPDSDISAAGEVDFLKLGCKK